MKKRTKQVLIITGILLLVFSVLSFTGAFVVVNKLAIPNIGTIKCIQLEPEKSIDYPVAGGDEIIKCSENTPYCDFIYTEHDGTVTGKIYVCDKYDNCNLVIDQSTGLGGTVYPEQPKSLGRVEQQGYVKLDLREPLLFGGVDKGDYTITKRFYTWGLQSFTTSGGFFKDIDRTSCTIPTSNLDQYPESSPTTLQFDQSTHFINYWNTVDEEINGDYLVNYNGKESFCLGNKIYVVDKFYAKDGTTYKYPGNVISYVDCCPGSISAGAICQDDFTWEVDSGEGETCFSPIQCRGQGDWIINYEDSSRLTIDKFGCEGGECIVIDSKKVECTSDFQCPNGQVCEEFKCEESSGTEWYISKDTFISTWLIILLTLMGTALIGLGSGVGYLLYKRGKRRR